MSVLVSCSTRELGYEHPDRRHGVFTASLLRGLLKPGGGTVDDLAKTVRTEVAAVVAADYNATQTPDLLAASPPAARPELTLDGLLADYLQGCDHLERVQPRRSAREKAAEAVRAIEALSRAIDAAPKDAPFLTDVYARARKRTGTRGSTRRWPPTASAPSRSTRATRRPTATWPRRCREQEKYEDAQAYHQRAINADPDYAQAYFARGRTHHLANELNLADNEYEHALRPEPAAALGARQPRVRPPESAEAGRGVGHQVPFGGDRTGPRFRPRLYGRGVAYTMKKQFKAAIVDLTRAIRLS